MTVETIERDTDTALIVVPQGQDAFALFSSKETTAADKLLSGIRAKIDTFKADLPSIATAAGRKKIASFAYKIAQSKSAVEEVGAALAKDAKDIPKRIDANRKHIKDTLDAWRDEVRKPVTDWEAAEEERINRIKTDLAELQHTIDDPDWMGRSSEGLRDRIGEIKADFEDVSEERFGEYTNAAIELKTRAVAVLTERIASAEKREAEAAELAKLRAEAEERSLKEREEQMVLKAAEMARLEAEARAEAERVAIENATRIAKEKADAAAQAERDAAAKREADLRAAAERAERERCEAEARAERAAREAKEQAEREARAAKEREAAEQLRREQDKAHRAAINREALAAFVENGLSEEVAKQVVTLIASRLIPNVAISY